MKKLLLELCKPKALLFIGPLIVVIYGFAALIDAHAGGSGGPCKGMIMMGLTIFLFLWECN